MERHFRIMVVIDDVWTVENELSEETPGFQQKLLKELLFITTLQVPEPKGIDFWVGPFYTGYSPLHLAANAGEAMRKIWDAKGIAEDREALIEAMYRRDLKFIARAVKPNPLLLRDDDDITRLVFKFAIELREPKLFSLIHKLPNKVAIVSSVDANNETLLHRAASFPCLYPLHHIQEPALQMQRELQWFKEVESIVSPAAREWKNTNHKKPCTLFTESHKDLITKAEKWMKETSNYLMLVSTLIATVTFASALSVPRGNNHDPDLLKSKFFTTFVISNTVTLFASATSMLVFLGILTSRFEEQDFLSSLPTKLMIGLSTLFLSIEAMIICFCVGLSITFHRQLWTVTIPAIGLVHIPVAIFMWRQFILMFNCFMFTYGPSIFDRNDKPWI